MTFLPNKTPKGILFYGKTVKGALFVTVTQLRTFLSVCQSMSFTQAAKQQYISQPAVSRQMSALEEELGAPLFERSHSAIQLTPAGQHLARHLKPIMDHLDALLNQVHEIGTGQSGTLVIGLMLDQSIDQRVSRAMQWFRQRHNITINIYRLSIMELISSLKNGTIDLAISIESIPNMFDGCEQYIYAREQMCFAARKDLLLKAGDRIDRTTVRRFADQHPVLTPKLGTFPPEHRETLANHAHEPSVAAAEVEYDLDSIAPMVAAGLGGTIVNESHILTSNSGIALFPYEDLPRINKGVFWMKDTANPLVPLFCNFLRSYDNTSRFSPDL